jgi:pimeloyl-ACP methyl ester carboxylesterase/hemoglobin-like flavoprotein
MGTPAYLAPELWWGDAATPRSDVFALGLVLYELLAGKLPHAHLDGEELAFAITDGELPSVRAGKPEIPESLAGIVARCLRREATERYASAVELVKALEEVESVFLPSLVPGSAVEMEPERLAVASSMARLSSRIQTLTTRLYERLFAADSSLRSLFPEELEAQKTKLAHALKLAIDGLAEPDRLVPVLEDLGRRHVRYGVVPGHFAELEKALLGALAELDHESWSPELEAAWRRAYSFIEQAMKRGMAAEHETMASSAALRRGTRRRPSSGETPRTRYAPSGDLSIAYQVVGEGPVDIVLMLGWITHVEIGWQHPTLANFLRELAGIGRLIFFDKRGTGMSDRAFESSTVEDRVDDLLAVLEHCGSKRAIVVGVSEGASTAAMFSLVHPSRVRGLVLYGASPRLLVDHDYPHGFPPAFLEEFVGKIRARWGDPSFTEMEAPSMARDVAFGEWLAMFMRMSASPGTAIAMFRLDAQLDLRRLLPKIALPTLVLHRSGDRIVPLAAARVLAEGIAAASFVELPGDDHLPFVGDSDAVLSAIERFVADVVESDVSATETAPLEAVLVVRQSDETPLPSAFADYCADRARSLGGERLPIDDAVVLAFRGGVKAVRCARELLDLAARAWLTIQMGLDASPRAPAGREHEMIAGATMLARTAPPSSVQASALLHELSRGSGLPFEPSADRSTCVLRASR